MYLIERILAAALVTAIAAHAQTSGVLNLSHDLTTNGIAKSNMVPNTPTLDSTPLFDAGVSWATSHGVTTVTVDRGNYYFLTQAAKYTHVQFGASNLNIDLKYSDLYFANGNQPAIYCYACSGVTLQNFTVDYLNLPFTQVQATAVNAAALTISYQTIPGWPAPSALNGYAIPGANDYLLYVFRNGQQVRQTAWMPAASPFNGSTLQITKSSLQGASSSNLAAIQPGDIVVVSFRANAGTILFGGGSNNTIRNVSVYSGSQLGFNIFSVSNTTLDQLQVIPRPATDRLISTSADGIHISLSGANNVISNSTVKRACDDGIIIDGQWYATVNAPANGATVAVTLIKDAPARLAVGMSLDFINIANASVIGTATITAVSPAVAQQTSGGVVTLTLDQTVSGLQANYGVIPSDPSLRGGGSVIRNNLVQEEVFDRGIYIPGVKNVTVTDNLIDSTNNGGIVIGEDDVNGYAYKTGPASGVTIHNNVVNNAMEYGYPTMSTVETGGAIIDYVTDVNLHYVTAKPDANFSITGNLVTNTPRSGIRVDSLNGGTISGNTIINASLEPTSYIDNFSTAWGETLQQIEAEFRQPIVIANSTGVTNSNNTTTGSILYSVSDASGGLRLAPGAIAAAYGDNLAPSPVLSPSPTELSTSLGGVTVTVTDSTGTARLAGLFFVSRGQIDYQVPLDTAPGVARVTVGDSVGGTLIGAVAPGLFSANGNAKGVAAALALRQAADYTQTPVEVFHCDSNGCFSTPMDLGAETDLLIVELYGTGIQGRSSLDNVVASVNGVPAPVLYAGSPGQYPGLDQVNLLIPRSLAGAGEVPVVLTVDGQTANVVTINIK